MKIYFAPMEGVTGYIYRNLHHEYYDCVDKYFSPFIVPSRSKGFKNKDLKDILPENNSNYNLVPQLLTNNAEDFLYAAKSIQLLGYHEINLNLGCPSGTVVSKNKGSGFLALREELDRFLDEIFSKSPIDISVKTRIGKDSPQEFTELIKIYNKYPMKELIIHPRIQKDFYKNKPDRRVFREAMSESKNPLVYNGDIFGCDDYKEFMNEFPEVDTIMIGRGLLANPGLAWEIREGNIPGIEILREFHDRILKEYSLVMYGDRNILFKMKELWSYMISMFPENEKYLKKIRKSESMEKYLEAVKGLFHDNTIKVSQ